MAADRIAERPRSTRRLSSWWLLALLLQASAGHAHAGTYDDAMSRAQYVVMTADYNNDGVQDVLMKATPGMVLIPLDDLLIPIPVQAPSPTFVLLSANGGTYTLVAAPDAAMLASTAWVNGTHTLSYSAATATSAGSMTIAAANSTQASFVISMAGDTGALQLTSTTPPTITPPPPPPDDTPVPDPAPVAVAIEPGHLNNPDAGTLPGELTVTAGGAAAYSIPIVVPPGSAGVQPSLSLNYSSSGTNGQLGLGWSLGGLSSIHRCGKTIAQDGKNDRIAFAVTDRLCLDGQRLVLTNLADTDQNYWADGAVFRTEIDSMSRITAEGAGDARTFKVEAKDGKIMYYGVDSARVVGYLSPAAGAKPGAQSWAIQRIEDRMQNRIRFEYTQDPVTGEHRPAFIRYGNGAESHAAVEFIYETRSDHWKRYIDETRNDLISRLASIKTHVGDNMNGAMSAGQMVREYKLTYEKSLTSGRSLIASVQAFARHPDTGVVESMPATTFSWGKPDPAKTAGFVPLAQYWAGAPILTKSNSTYGKMHPEYFSFTDFGNDGRTDVLEKQVAPIGGKRDPGEDGKQWGTLQSQYRYFHNNGNGFTEYAYRLNTAEPFVVVSISDFNGDGSPDLVASTAADSSKVCISPLGTPAGPGPAGTVIVFTCEPASYLLTGNQGFAGAPSYYIDVVGDGRTAHYAPVDADGVSRLCIQALCVNDPNPPKVVPRQNPSELAPHLSATEYVSMSAMVDFTGIGKPYDVRWSKPYFVEAWYEDNGQTKIQGGWQNLTPTVNMVGFNLPGSGAAGMMAEYAHAPYYPTPGHTPPRPPYIFDEPYQGGNLTADFSGSGYNSLAFGFRELIYPTDGVTNSKAELILCQSTGRALDCAVRRKYSGNQYRTIVTMGNFVGDGLPSILTQTNVQPIGGSVLPTRILEMCRVMGDDESGGTSTTDDNMKCDPWSAGQPMLGNNFFFMDLLGTGRMQMVKYHAGSVVNGLWQENGAWEIFVPTDIAVTGQALDRIHQVTNGVSAKARVEYFDGPTTSAHDEKPLVRQTGITDINANYPQHLTPSLGKVVRNLVTSTGRGDTRTQNYFYADAAVDVSGRGSLGFGTVAMRDQSSGITTTTLYNHKWPMTGLARTITVVSNDNVKLSETENALSSQTIFHAASGKQTVIPFVSSATVRRKDLDGSDLGMVVTESIYDDTYSNLKEQLVTSQGAGKIFKTKSVTTYQNDPITWLIGLPTETTITKTDPDTGIGARTVNYSYGTNGQLHDEVIEKNNPALKLTTTFNREVKYGLVTTKVQSWLDPRTGSPVSRTVSNTQYDVKGRFPHVVKNALDHSEVHDNHAGTGASRSLVGPNGLTTTWVSDGFGRVSKERRADGGETRTYTKQCVNDCPSGAVVVQVTDTFNNGQRITVPHLTYMDDAGHVILKKTWGFNGSVVLAETEFDTSGRPRQTFQPRFESAERILESRNTYDDLNRTVLVETLDPLGGAQGTSTVFNGFETTTTNPNNQARVDTRNVIGQLVGVKDALHGLISYAYEPFGNLQLTTDPRGNSIKVHYDNVGRKIELIDPDLGHIVYSNDPAGRVWKQTTPVQRANGSATEMYYDALDRMTSRVDADLNATWQFDTAANGIGQLAQTFTGSATNRDYQRIHSYDQFGRSTVVKQVLSDGNYYSTTEYDSFGRVLAQRYKRLDGGIEKRFANRYNDKGYLRAIMRGSLALTEIQEMDAAGRTRAASLGNGLNQKRSYDRNTGHLMNVQLDLGTQQRVLENYHYDAIGSVKQRSQYWGAHGFVENFSYDKLNRLETSSLIFGGQQATREETYTYFADGAIKSKTGVGTGDYEYPVQGPTSVRPHAVRSIPSVGSFTYDDNGNMLSDSSRTVSWNSFDMPKRISKGATYSEFVYGSEHQRVRQNRSDGTISVYAGAQEVETIAGKTTVKTYWPGGAGLEIEKTGLPIELVWTHVDRLGSPIAISDAVGNLKERLAYDAWGKRRSVVDGSAPNETDGVVDNRGFTNHEMLDQLDLVHMNGRIYDPFTAKFISGDPIIQDPTNGQNYNRYSYVFNNPTNLTDPTGFSATHSFGSECPIGQSVCAKTAQSAVNDVQKSIRGLPAEQQNATRDKIRAEAAKAGVKVDVNANTKPSAKNGGGISANTKDAQKRGSTARIDPGAGQFGSITPSATGLKESPTLQGVGQGVGSYVKGLLYDLPKHALEVNGVMGPEKRDAALEGQEVVADALSLMRENPKEALKIACMACMKLTPAQEANLTARAGARLATGGVISGISGPVGAAASVGAITGNVMASGVDMKDRAAVYRAILFGD